MARKAKPQRKVVESVKPKHRENRLQRFAEEIEAHLMEGAELATSTTSSETNIALAAIGAIEGPVEPKPKPEKKAGKRGKARPKAR